MIDPIDYTNKEIPTAWLPKTLADMKQWTYGELAKDRTTKWTAQDGHKYIPRQLLYIWKGIAPQQIADMAEDRQQEAIQRQQIAMAMLELFPSESKEKKPSTVKAKAS